MRSNDETYRGVERYVLERDTRTNRRRSFVRSCSSSVLICRACSISMTNERVDCDRCVYRVDAARRLFIFIDN
jgi:hypothetical protein